MEILKLYDYYFDIALKHNTYNTTADYMEDLYYMIDAYIQAAYACNEIQSGNERQPQTLHAFKEHLELEFMLIWAHIESRVKCMEECQSLPFYKFSKQLNLSRFKQFCLILGGAIFTENKYERDFSILQGNNQLKHSTKAFAIALYQLGGKLAAGEWREIRKNGKFYRLCFQHSESEEHLEQRLEGSLMIRSVLFFYFSDELIIDERLVEIAEVWNPAAKPEPLLIYEEQKNRLIRLADSQPGPNPRVTILQGKRGSGRKLLLKHLAYCQKKRILFVDCEGLLHIYMEYGMEIIEILELELLLADAFLCLSNRDAEQNTEAKYQELIKKLAARDMSCFITTEDQSVISWGTLYEQLVIELPPATAKEKAILWQHFMKEYKIAGNIDGEMLGCRYLLNAGEIKSVLQTAKLCGSSYGRNQIEEVDIISAVQAHNQNTFGAYAQQIQAFYTWDHLVVPESVRAQLMNICNQMKYRGIVLEQWGFYEKRPYGRGICALFFGPPGTGKTMAVQVLAKELGLSLYRVDLSQMTSKYIGETQKNISTLFERARNTNALLFFDEADAFFSKRTKVNDANDRHGNSEVAHLLQQLEAYDGLSILATNLKENMDDAFKRRIKMMVHFQLPEAETRKILWQKALPKKMAVAEEVRVDFFAGKFELSGSEIQEILLNAAFMAAAEDHLLNNECIVRALKNCFLKYGKVLTQDDFEGLN